VRGDRAVGMVTYYILEVLRSNTGRGNNFRTRPDRSWDPPDLLCNRYWVSHGVKQLRPGVDTPTHSSPEVQWRPITLWVFMVCHKVNITYLLTPWSRVLLEKLTGSAASQEIPRIFGTRRFITVLTSARHLSLSWTKSIRSLQPPPTHRVNITIQFCNNWKY